MFAGTEGRSGRGARLHVRGYMAVSRPLGMTIRNQLGHFRDRTGDVFGPCFLASRPQVAPLYLKLATSSICPRHFWDIYMVLVSSLIKLVHIVCFRTCRQPRTFHARKQVNSLLRQCIYTAVHTEFRELIRYQSKHSDLQTIHMAFDDEAASTCRTKQPSRGSLWPIFERGTIKSFI